MGAKKSKTIKDIITYTLLLLGLAVVIIPFLFMISTALKPHTFVFQIPPKLIPDELTSVNFTNALTKENFGGYFLNSVVVGVSTTITTIIISAMMAYAFARISYNFV